VQKLLSGDVTEGPHCFEFTPTSDFSEVLYVTRGANQTRSTGYFDPQFELRTGDDAEWNFLAGVGRGVARVRRAD
jgi:hypothetical protein